MNFYEKNVNEQLHTILELEQNIKNECRILLNLAHQNRSDLSFEYLLKCVTCLSRHIRGDCELKNTIEKFQLVEALMTNTDDDDEAEEVIDKLREEWGKKRHAKG